MNNFYINKKVNPKSLKQNEYDAIIIGAGIEGLNGFAFGGNNSCLVIKK